jgi:protein TonB
MLQTGLVAALVIVPLMHPEVLHPKFDVPIWVPLMPIVEKRVDPQKVAIPGNVAVRHSYPRVFDAPTRVPAGTSRVVDALPEPDYAIMGPLSGSSAGPVITGLTQLLPEHPPQPAPFQTTKPPAPTGPVRVGGTVQAANLIFSPTPPYPQIAKTAGVQGTVKLQAVIAIDGSIKNLQLIGGHPLLVRAALDAVRQWRYRPTLLNGSPVEVLTEIEVNFKLSR